MAAAEPTPSLKKSCCQQHLTEISKQITDWKNLAFHLDFSPTEMDDLDQSSETLPVKKITMLMKWKRKARGKATYSMLADAFHSIQRNDWVDEVEKIILSTPCSVAKATTLANDLRKKYNDPNEAVRAGLLFLRMPVPRKFFRLVIVKQEISHRPEDSARVLSMKGGINTVVKKKTPIKLEDIFTEDGSEGKVILIEGAPGSGKSTLLWHVCQKWGSGELFQQFNLIIYIQLRNPDIQSAKSFADLMPCKKEEAEGILEELEEVEGKGVLFLLDGWDELPPSVQQQSFIHDLLNRSPKSALSLSSFIVSSRHMPSNDYSILQSSNLEIVGFTDIEVKECLNDLLNGDKDTLGILLERLKANPHLASSCYLPLNVVIIAHVFMVMGLNNLPSTMLKILEYLLLNIILRHMKKNPLKSCPSSLKSFESLPTAQKESLNFLCHLAFQGLMEGRVIFEQEKVSTCCDTLSLLQEIACLEIVGTGIRYSFLHLVIQEFLAAFHMSKMPDDEQMTSFNTMFPDQRYAKVLQFYAGFTKMKSKKIQDALHSAIEKSVESNTNDILDLHSDMTDFHIAEDIGDGNLTSLKDTFKMVRKRKKPSFGMEYIIAANCLFEANIPELFKLFSIPYFTISNIPMTPSDCLALGKLTALATMIQEPRLNLCSLDNLCIEYFKRGLLSEDTKRVICVHIADPGIDEVGIKILSELFCKGIIVQLVGCELIAARGFLTILEIIESIKAIIPQCIVLKWCKVEINDKNGPLLQHLIKQNNNLWYLDLQGNEGVGDIGAQFIGRGLKESCSLTHINLEECNITPKGARRISNGLKKNTSVKSLKLSCNCFGDKGAACIGEVLENNNTIKELELNNCRLLSKGAEMISKGLEHNKSVKVLDLSYNDIGDEGAAYIGEALKCNTTLEKINLFTCCLSSEGARHVSIGLKHNNSVKYLDLSINCLEDKGADFIGEAIKHNQTLEELDVTVCSMTYKGMMSLKELFVCRKVSNIRRLNFVTDFERVVS